MTQHHRGSRLLAAGLLLVGLAAGSAVVMGSAAQAVLPAPDRVLAAAAKRNRDSGRGQALRFDVALFIADAEGAPPAEALATGTLWSAPDGRVGLELQASAGFVERHVLRAGVLRASRDGAPLESPRPFLPPFPVFQPRSSGALQGALQALGVDHGQVGLAYEGASDCYVVGGRGSAAAFWIDQETLDPVRLDRGDGVQWRLGPTQESDEIWLPRYIEVLAPGLPAARLIVRGGSKAETMPSLDPAWLAFTQPPEEVR